MSECPERALPPASARPAGKYGAVLLSVLLLVGGFLLLSIPAMWILSALKWTHPPLVPQALLTLAVVTPLALSGWLLARWRGWDDQERHARLLGLSLLRCFAITLLEMFLVACPVYDIGTQEGRYWLAQCVRLLQFLLSVGSLHLLYRSFALLPGRRRMVSAGIEEAVLPKGCRPVSTVSAGSAVSGQAARSAGKGRSRIMDCLLLTICALLLSILPLWMHMPWWLASLPLVPALPLTLTALWLARRWGCARQEAQALFLRRTVLYCFVIPLLESFLPEIELRIGGGIGRVFERLEHLDLYACRWGIRMVQCVVVCLVGVRLLWSVSSLLTRRPISGYPMSHDLVELGGFLLLVFAPVYGIILLLAALLAVFLV